MGVKTFKNLCKYSKLVDKEVHSNILNKRMLK